MIGEQDFHQQLERINHHLNEIQLVCDDERMPQELTDAVMRHQKAIKNQVDQIAEAIDYEEDEEEDDEEEEEEDDDDESGESGGQ